MWTYIWQGLVYFKTYMLWILYPSVENLVDVQDLFFNPHGTNKVLLSGGWQTTLSLIGLQVNLSF